MSYKKCNILWPLIDSLEDGFETDNLHNIFPNKNIILYDTEDNLLFELKKIIFENTYIIINDRLVKKFLEKFEEEINNIKVIPKFIIYSPENSEVDCLDNYPYFENFKYGRTFDEIIDFLKSQEDNNNYNDVSSVGISSNSSLIKPEEDKFFFEIIDKMEKLVLPVYYKTMIKIDFPDRINEMTKYIYKNYKQNPQIESLLSQIINIKNIPNPLLCKYWVRIYTAKGFHNQINDYLKSGQHKKFLIYIQMMYEGLHTKSLKGLKDNITLYRGTQLSNYEFNLLKQHMKKKNIDAKIPIISSRAFLSFSKSEEVALRFAFSDEDLDSSKMKRVLFILKDRNNNTNQYLDTYADIEELSFYPDEEEVLFFPFSSFEIINFKTKVKSDGSDDTYEEIELNYLSHYDKKLKKLFRKSKNINLVNSEFKKNIIDSELIEEDKLSNSSISTIINNSKEYVENQKKIEKNSQNQNKKNSKIHDILNENTMNSLNPLNSEHKEPPNEINPKNDNNNENKYESNLIYKFFRNKKVLGGVILSFILIVVILILATIIKKEKRKSSEQDINNKNLRQYSFETIQNYETMQNGEISPFKIYSKSIYELYSLNSNSSTSKVDENYENDKYITTIALNSFCNKLIINSGENNCELKPILDLNKKQEYNLRRNNDNDYSIKDALLPICKVEHTGTNLITSVTCPNTVTNNLKQEIIEVFKIIEQSSIEKFDNVSYNNDNNVYVNISKDKCSDINKDNIQSKECYSTTKIITDKKGNFISISKISYNKIIQNEQNMQTDNITYELKNIAHSNSVYYDEKVYKSNLDILLSITSFLMEKEIYNNNKELLLNSNIAKNSNLLGDNLIKKEELRKKNIFNKYILDVPFELNLVNDIGFGQNKNIQLYSLFNINNNDIEIGSKNFQINLDDILKQLISLLRSSNKLVYDLNSNLNETLLKFKDKAKEYFLKINNYLIKEDLTEIFDSIFAIKQIDSLPYDFILTVDNLLLSMNELDNNIPKILNSTLINLENSISNFLNGSHNYISDLLSQIINITNYLNSKENKIYEISLYYLNYKKAYYSNFISGYKNILINYYKKEKDIILPFINDILDNFYENSMFFIQRFNNKLGIISERLNKKDLMIISSTHEDCIKVIISLQLIKNKVNDILFKIQNKALEYILKDNGYFENKKNLEEKINYYENIISKAQYISYILDNNELIDKTFDNTMINLKNSFLFLLNYMENSLKEKFPFEFDLLGHSYFDGAYLNHIAQNFALEKEKIFYFINKENDEYLESMKNIFNYFIKNNGTSFKQSLFQLINDFDTKYFININNVFDDFLIKFLKEINGTIENNSLLALEYLNDVISAESYHITQGFINKYNIYI